AHGHSDRQQIRDAMDFIRERAHRRLSVEQIARHVGMSPSHFAHRFRAVARVTPMGYVKTIRMHRARVALLRNGGRASEVALEVGYASTSHFTRDFKNYYGVPPTDFVRQNRVARAEEASVGPAEFGFDGPAATSSQDLATPRQDSAWADPGPQRIFPAWRMQAHSVQTAPLFHPCVWGYWGRRCLLG